MTNRDRQRKRLKKWSVIDSLISNWLINDISDNLLVQRGQDDEHEVPDQQDDSKLPVHPPAVVVGEEDQEDDGSDQDDGRIQETFLQAFLSGCRDITVTLIRACLAFHSVFMT